MNTLSIYKCRKIVRDRLGYSPSFGFFKDHHSQGNLKASESVSKGGQKSLLVLEEEFENFYTEYIENNKRIARAPSKTPSRRSYISKGYKLLFLPDHHRSNIDGYVPEHVVQAEKKLKRRLKDKEQVHHIDGNKLNNAVDNLVVFKNLSEHLKEGHGNVSAVALYLKQKSTFLKTANDKQLACAMKHLLTLYKS